MLYNLLYNNVSCYKICYIIIYHVITIGYNISCYLRISIDSSKRWLITINEENDAEPKSNNGGSENTAKYLHGLQTIPLHVPPTKESTSDSSR